MKDALLIIDMQKVYLPNKQWACENIVNTINNIEKKIKGFDKRHIFSQNLSQVKIQLEHGKTTIKNTPILIQMII